MLAASAAKAGLRCRVIDLFGDGDTRALAERTETTVLAGYNFQKEALLAAVGRLDPEQRCGVIYGSGCEADPEVLTALCRKRPLLGNSPATINTVKQPESLVSLLQTLGIPHPEIRFDPPQTGDWLEKQTGACGGRHIRRVCLSSTHRKAGVYYQQFVAGRSLSATCLANGHDAIIIGFCEQWHAGLADHPFIYGGAISLNPAALPAMFVRDIQDAAKALTERTGLTGLWGIDLIAADETWWLLEINPRPCATLELHEGEDSLLSWHIAAAQNPSHLPIDHWHFETHRGHAIVYAEREINIAVQGWPHWISDRPHAGAVIKPGEPVCTVHAQGHTVAAVREKLNHLASLGYAVANLTYKNN
jgi:predicted ATP-grasp superfamily ATP-dependent carboligase